MFVIYNSCSKRSINTKTWLLVRHQMVTGFHQLQFRQKYLIDMQLYHSELRFYPHFLFRIFHMQVATYSYSIQGNALFHWSQTCISSQTLFGIIIHSTLFHISWFIIPLSCGSPISTQITCRTLLNHSRKWGQTWPWSLPGWPCGLLACSDPDSCLHAHIRLTGSHGYMNQINVKPISISKQQ